LGITVDLVSGGFLWTYPSIAIACPGGARSVMYFPLGHYPLVNHEKLWNDPACLMGQLTISMAIFKFANCHNLPEGNPNQPFLTIIYPFQPLYPSFGYAIFFGQRCVEEQKPQFSPGVFRE